MLNRDVLLDLWASGMNERVIIAEIEKLTGRRYSLSFVSTVLSASRKRGDTRAVYRKQRRSSIGT